MDIDFWHAQLAGSGQSVFDIERAADWCRASPDLTLCVLPALARMRLAHALLAVDPQGQDRVMALAAMFRLHEGPRVRRAAAGQLCEVGSDDALAHIVEHLLVATGPSVVESIASSLGERLSESPELSEAVEAARERVRGAAAFERGVRRGS